MINVQQITSKLRMMPDQQLQNYAMQNKDDPYTVSLALSEANTRKQMRSNQQAKMAGMQQPTVVDQDIAEMAVPQQMPQMPQQAPQQMAQAQLPENTGIGQLPAQNMQRMADGGIVGYADGGEVEHFRRGGVSDDDVFNQAFLRTLKYEGGRTNDTGGDTKYGISKKGNPDVDIDKLTIEGARKLYKERYWNAISGDKLAARDPKLAQAAFDTAVNQGVSKAKQFVTESGGDVSKLMQLRGEHYDNLAQQNPKKYGEFAKGWMNRLGNLATDLAIPSAVAGEMPKTQPTGLAQIPTGGVPGAGPTAPGPDTRSYFGKVADQIGIPEEYQRNINNTLSALGGWTAPAAGVSKGVGIASKELAATPEMLAKAEQLKNATALTRLAPPVAKGIEALAPEAQATRAAAENARRVRQMSEDVNAAKGAEQSIKAADITSDIARSNEQALAAQQQARMLDSAKAANVGRATTGMQAIDAMQTEPRATGLPMDDLGFDRSGLDALDKADKKEIIDVAKASLPKGKGSDYGNDFLLMLGLGLMGGQSPNALTNLGQAGIGALKHVQESRKDEADRLYKESLAKHYGVPNEVQMLEYLKDPENMANYMRQREAMGDPAMMKELVTEYIKNPAGLAYLETKNPAIYNMIKQQATRALTPPKVASLPGAGANTRPPV